MVLFMQHQRRQGGRGAGGCETNHGAFVLLAQGLTRVGPAVREAWGGEVSPPLKTPCACVYAVSPGWDIQCRDGLALLQSCAGVNVAPGCVLA